MTFEVRSKMRRGFINIEAPSVWYLHNETERFLIIEAVLFTISIHWNNQ